MPMCLKHHDRPATTRCTTCFKPLCSDCAVVVGAEVFCSTACQQSFNVMANRTVSMAAREQAKARQKLVKRIMILLVLLAVGAAVYLYVKSDPATAKWLKREVKSLQNEVRKETRGMGSTMFVEGRVKRTVNDFAEAVLGSHWATATALCATNMTWIYYNGDQATLAQGSNAVKGFFDSISTIENRDGFNIEIKTVKLSDTKATVQGDIRIPICYNRTQMNYGKMVIPTQFSLTQQSGKWVITSIAELSQRRKN